MDRRIPTTENRIERYVNRFAPTEYSQIQIPETYFPQLLDELTEYRMHLQNPTDEWKPAAEEGRANPVAFAGRKRAEYRSVLQQAWQEIVLDRFPPEVDETGNSLEDRPSLPSDPSLDPAQSRPRPPKRPRGAEKSVVPVSASFPYNAARPGAWCDRLRTSSLVAPAPAHSTRIVMRASALR